MNRILINALALSMCLCLVACGTQIPESPFEKPPSKPSDIESIIEPLEASSSSEIPPEESTGDASAKNEASQIASSSAKDEDYPENEAVPEPKKPAETPVDAKASSKSGESSAPEVPLAAAGEVLPTVAPEKKLDATKIERELLRLINAEREAVGAQSLGLEDNMVFAARIRAGEALENFSHTRPDGFPYNTAFDEAGFSYAGKWHGENLASIDFTAGMFTEKAAAQEMFTELKNSPGHYQNMISDNFLQTGIGAAISYGDGMVSIASSQLFSSL